MVARIVAAGDADDLYFDGDVHPTGTTQPLHCSQ
jgi:hypothetical protein